MTGGEDDRGMVKASVTINPGQPGDSGGTISRINSGYQSFQGVFSGGNAIKTFFILLDLILGRYGCKLDRGERMTLGVLWSYEQKKREWPSFGE